MSRCSCVVLLSLFSFVTALAQTPSRESEIKKLGHSRHGDAFDEGPRQKPWRMEGIGRSHFQVTTSVPEVEEWFDQGHTLLHSFWYFEAERAFRWCLKLDPECAMAWWGLARSVRMEGEDGAKRRNSILKEALRRKDKVSRRERLYLDAWEAAYLLDPGRDTEGKSETERLVGGLERIVLEFPDDVEAKALLALQNIWGGPRFATELVLREILARESDHPGAHHYRIHVWDGPEGQIALESCARYGVVAPYVGHANHMPGHVYSGLGMWHEAAYSMDSATRVEQHYMRQCMTQPFNTWNYAHNRNYLAYIQEQLGMPEAALMAARELLAAPIDQRYNNPDKPGYSVHREGLDAMLRTLVKYELWKEVQAIPWRKTSEDTMWSRYCAALVALAETRPDDAAEKLRELQGMKAEIDKPENQSLRDYHEILCLELQGHLDLARDRTLEGLGSLTKAAERELALRKKDDDPPNYPRNLYVVLGESYLHAGSPGLAVKAFTKALENVSNDGFALAGLARAHAATGDRAQAQVALSRLLHVWSVAEADNRWLAAARALGIEAHARDSSPGAQRLYRRADLDAVGPMSWEPYDAPALSALDTKGQKVVLEDYRGKNVLLVFYLGDECPHCVEQLAAISRRCADFNSRNTEILAISKDSPQENLKLIESGKLPFRLLSDPGLDNARRFQSYDDFEDLELHSTLLIDASGKIRWSRQGGDPFEDIDFLLAEIDRLNPKPADTLPAAGG